MASPLKRQTPRRLFELLEEKQEPFFLQSHGYKSRRCSGILRSLINKFICSNVVKKVIVKRRAKLLDDSSETRRLSSNSSAVNGDTELKSVKHSPISVLELHYSDEGSSDHNQSMEEDNWSISGSIMHTNFSLGGETRRNMNQPRHLLLDYLKEMEDRYRYSSEFKCQKLCWETVENEIFPWEKQTEDVSYFKYLLNFDSLDGKMGWDEFQVEKRVIGTEIEGIIFEEMREECVINMLACI